MKVKKLFDYGLKLADLMLDMTKAELEDLVLWCYDRNMMVSTVSHSLWDRERRG